MSDNLPIAIQIKPGEAWVNGQKLDLDNTYVVDIELVQRWYKTTKGYLLVMATTSVASSMLTLFVVWLTR